MAHSFIVVDVYVPLLLLHCRRGILRNHYQTLFLTTMPLSAITVSRIADALKDDIIEHIYANEKYNEVMRHCVQEALDAKMGEMDEDLYFDLGMCLYERIELK